MTLTCSASHALLSVRDHGKGFRKATPASRQRGWGLENMRERARLLNGTLEVTSLPHQGARIHVKIPFDKTSG